MRDAIMDGKSHATGSTGRFALGGTLALACGALLYAQPPQPEAPPPPVMTAAAGAGNQVAQAAPAPERLPPPRKLGSQTPGATSADYTAEAADCGIKGAMPISLPVALRLAGTTNLDIAQAREVVAAAGAALQRANVSWMPNFNLGSTYAEHEGNIQKTEGNIIKANRDSLFVGGGPSMSFGFAEAIFTPLAARQVVASTQAGLQRVSNDTMLAVADAYFAMLRARRQLARVNETLDFLTSNATSANRSNSKGLLPLVRDFVEVGGAEALKSELERVRVEVLRRDEERAAAVEDYLVASAELARLIRLDPAVPLWPVEDYHRPIPLPGGAWLKQPVQELAATALANRPELAENQALVRAALERLKTAKYRPLLPNLIVNYNWGDFGGGPDPNSPIVTVSGGRVTTTTVPGFGTGGELKHFNTRSDFDATLVWRLTNMGFGNLAEVRANQADARRLELRQLQLQDLVVAQVVQVSELVTGWRRRLDISGSALWDARGRANGPVFQSLRLNFDRIRNVPGARPLEVLDSIRGLNDLLQTYAADMTDYDRARFRLIVALGMAPDKLLDPRAAGPGMPPPPGEPAPNVPADAKK